MTQAIEVLDRPQHVEVIDALAELPGFNHRPKEDSGNLIALCAVILIPGDNQQAVMSFCKLDIWVDVGLQPGIALLDGAVMHVVVQIGHHDGDGGQGGEVCRKAGEGQIARGGYIGEINPGIVLARVSPGSTNRGPGCGQVL
jgi:hypothetical protein